MIVSYDNKMINATIAATNEDLNNPVTNLIHNFLKLAFYSIGNSSVVTVTFDTTYDIDHIAYGYHNMNSMSVSFYDVFDVLIKTEVITIEDNENIFYFTVAEGVKKAVFTCTTLASELYIGSIFTGEYLDLPLFQQSPQSQIEMNDSSFQSAGGQSSGNRKQNLDTHPLSFANITNTERFNLKTYADIAQTSKPHFIDMYPDAHDEFPVFYGKIISKNIPTGKRRISNFRYNASITYKECR